MMTMLLLHRQLNLLRGTMTRNNEKKEQKTKELINTSTAMVNANKQKTNCTNWTT